jgi:cell fate (sporulation/competence/biofilm development) regulator YlbF (YheA/YmcA/DUF963 family)
MNPTLHVTRSLVDAAESFAQAIVNSPEWEEWRAARAARERAPDVVRWTRELNQVMTSRAVTASLSAAEASRLQDRIASLQQSIARHPASAREQAAGSALVQLLQEANQLVSTSLGVDFAGSAAPRQGGCCG